jgi:hypothetical protein
VRKTRAGSLSKIKSFVKWPHAEAAETRKTTMQPDYVAIRKALEKFCTDHNIGAGAPEGPVSDGMVGSALYGAQLIADGTITAWGPPLVIGVGGAVKILNGVRATLAVKLDEATNAIGAGIGGTTGPQGAS